MRLIIAIAALFLFWGCQSGKNKIDENAVVSIAVRLDNNRETILYSRFFDSVRYVKLETNDESILGNPSKVKFVGNRFYILDKKQHVLAVFSETGEFLLKIDKRGLGPREYYSISDFDVNGDKLLLFDPNRNVLEYDISGKFIKNYPVRIFGTSIAFNGAIACIYTCNFSSKEGDYQLLVLDSYGQDFKAGISLAQKSLLNDCKSYQSQNAFQHYNDEIRFFMPFSTKIYSIVGDSIYARYNFDFGEFNIPEDYFEHHTRDDVENSQYAYGLNSFWENDAYFFFNVYGRYNLWDVLYCKEENTLSCGNFYDDLAFCSPAFQESNNDFALGICPVDELYDKYNRSNESRKNTVLEKIIAESDFDDNPVIFFYYFKGS
jgi:hypothetical protein